MKSHWKLVWEASESTAQKHSLTWLIQYRNTVWPGWIRNINHTSNLIGLLCESIQAESGFAAFWNEVNRMLVAML